MPEFVIQRPVAGDSGASTQSQQTNSAERQKRPDLPALDPVSQKALDRILEQNPGYRTSFALERVRGADSSERSVILSLSKVSPGQDGRSSELALKMFEVTSATGQTRELALLNRDTGEPIKEEQDSRRALLKSPWPGITRIYTDVGVVHYAARESRLFIANTPGIRELEYGKPALYQARWDGEAKQVELLPGRSFLNELSPKPK